MRLYRIHTIKFLTHFKTFNFSFISLWIFVSRLNEKNFLELSKLQAIKSNMKVIMSWEVSGRKCVVGSVC